MISHLKNLLVQNGFTEQTVPEQIIYIIVSDNLDLACSVMEKTAAEKSIPEVDETMSSAYINRRKHKERSNQPFYDMSIFGASRYPSLLPEALRLKPGGLTPAQLRVYEDFMRVSRSATPPSESSSERPVIRAPPPVPKEGTFTGPSEPVGYENAPSVLSSQQAFDKFNVNFLFFLF